MGKASCAPAAAADSMGFGCSSTPGHSLVTAAAPQPCPPPASCLASPWLTIDLQGGSGRRHPPEQPACSQTFLGAEEIRNTLANSAAPVRSSATQRQADLLGPWAGSEWSPCLKHHGNLQQYLYRNLFVPRMVFKQIGFMFIRQIPLVIARRPPQLLPSLPLCRWLRLTAQCSAFSSIKRKRKKKSIQTIKREHNRNPRRGLPSCNAIRFHQFHC